MSTAPESQPEAVPPTTTKPPFYRRPLVLIIAGAVVLMLIVGGILTAVTLVGKNPAAHLAAGTTSRPTTVTKSTSTSTSSETPTPTPTPTASVAQPQPQAGAPAPKAPTAPVAPVAPVAPAPAPPISVGPTRPSPTAVSITTFTVSPMHCPNGPDLSTVAVTFAWTTVHATGIYLKDEKNEIPDQGLNGFADGPNGSVTMMLPCTATPDAVTLTANKSTFPTSTAKKYGDIIPIYG